MARAFSRGVPRGEFPLPDQIPALPHIFTYLGPGIPVRCHDHIALVQQGGSLADPGTEFLREGLGMCHHCCFLASVALHAGLLARLRGLGVDVQRHAQDQTLRIPRAMADSDALLGWMNRFFAEAEAARAPAARWLEEGVSAKPADLSIAGFFELHSRLNYLVKEYPSVALCRYNTEDLEIPHLFSILAVHRHLLVEGTLVRDNPFYIPAEKFIAMQPEERERDLRDLFREVGFDLKRLLSTLAGYGRLQPPPAAES